MFERTLKRLRDGIVSIAYPESCRICADPVESLDDGVVCAACWQDETVTRLLNGTVLCFKCGAPLLSTGGSVFSGDSKARSSSAVPAEQRFCGNCTDASFTVARACGAYGGALEASILFLKTHPHICGRLRRLVSETVRWHWKALKADVVIPVPLHRQRERKRGFNQAAIIARSISGGFRIEMDQHSLVRVKATERHRAGMDAADRRRSVEGAFEVSRPRLIEGAAVLLVDDVYTTGSTVASAAKVLVEAGAAQANVLTLARVISGLG